MITKSIYLKTYSKYILNNEIIKIISLRKTLSLNFLFNIVLEAYDEQILMLSP